MKYVSLAPDLKVSQIGLGCWPMAGITSIDVHETQSLSSIEEALKCGVNFFDTAYSYGYSGECDELLLRARTRWEEQIGHSNLSAASLSHQHHLHLTNSVERDSKTTSNSSSNAANSDVEIDASIKESVNPFVIATKVGQYWNEKRERMIDGSPERLIDHAQKSWERLGGRTMDLLYLHSPDPNVAIRETAHAMQRIKECGMARHIGVCNVDLSQLREFSNYCELAALQIPFNMFQQNKLEEIKEFASTQRISVVAYWVLMKGLLAGHMTRNHQFAPEDIRATYPIFQGKQWELAQRLLDKLRLLALECSVSIPQLVIAWALSSDRADVVLIGAKKPSQVAECLGNSSVGCSLSELIDSPEIQQIDSILSALTE